MRRRYFRPMQLNRFGYRINKRPVNFARYREDDDGVEGKTNEEALTQKCATINRQFFGGNENEYRNDRDLITLTGTVIRKFPDSEEFDDAYSAGEQIIKVIRYYEGEDERPRSVAVSEPAEIIAPRIREYLGIEEEPQQDEQPIEEEQGEPEESKWEGQEFEYADIRVLSKGKAAQRSEKEKKEHNTELKELQNSILSILENTFNIKSQPDTVSEGPATTQYEFVLDKNVRVKKEVGTDAKKDEIAQQLKSNLRMNGVRVRVIPEHGTIAVEIPNKERESVPLRDVLESPEWLEAKEKMAVPAALGKDTEGKPVFFDLAKMPHGLIAGSSGSGKSVCINSIITSLIYGSTPEDTQLLLIDPKGVEFFAYRNMPHLIAPVITNMDEAVDALTWLANEMDRRYDLIMDSEARNIDGYNNKIMNTTGAKKMPRIICIVDEFGDLMTTHRQELEILFARLSQKARASGIHLIFSTQRPDTKTITGTIKNNLTYSIALTTKDNTNSRLIIGESGAEKLLGMGDMLVPDGHGGYKRVQGAWVSDEDVQDVVNDLILNNGKAQYSPEIEKALKKRREGDDTAPKKRNYYREAFNLFLTHEDQINATFLRATLGISSKDARTILKGLEEHGYITPPEGMTNTRRLLRDTWGSKKKSK